MAYANLARVQLEFSFDGGTSGKDVQDTGFWCQVGLGTSSPEVAMGVLAQRVAQAWSDNLDPVNFTAAVSGTRVKTYWYGANPPPGKAQAGGESAFPGGWAGSGAFSMPPENTMVLSTYSFAPGTFVPNKGRRRRGRMYLPTFPPQLMDAKGRLTTGNRDALLEECAAFFDDVQGATSGLDLISPVVVSSVDQAQYKITYLRMGDLVDTQRRRRNRLDEAYAVATITNP